MVGADFMEYPIVAIAKRTFDALIMRRGGVSRKQGPREAGMRPSANHRLPPMFHHFSNEEQA